MHPAAQIEVVVEVTGGGGQQAVPPMPLTGAPALLLVALALTLLAVGVLLIGTGRGAHARTDPRGTEL